MQRIEARVLIGLLLIGAGVIYLLQNLGVISWGSLVWALALAVGGAIFLGIFARNREHWWALIPGLTLLGLAAASIIDTLVPALSPWTGSLFLGSVGLSFWVIYALDRQHWWAIIPGGVLMTLAVVSGLDDALGIDTGGLFFIGLGLTFVLVAIVPAPGQRNTWAFIPAGGLLLFGLLLTVGFEAALGYIWPAVLIVAGLLLMFNALRRTS